MLSCKSSYKEKYEVELYYLDKEAKPFINLTSCSSLILTALITVVLPFLVLLQDDKMWTTGKEMNNPTPSKH
jgi:hypothetical protein